MLWPVVAALLPSSQGTTLERDKRSPWVMVPAHRSYATSPAPASTGESSRSLLSLHRRLRSPPQQQLFLDLLYFWGPRRPIPPEGGMEKVKREGACHNNCHSSNTPKVSNTRPKAGSILRGIHIYDFKLLNN